MTIHVSPEYEQIIAKAIKSGAFKTPEDVVGRALEVLRLEDLWQDDGNSLVSEKIERAFAQFERGESFGPEEAQAEMQTRKAEWQRAGGILFHGERIQHDLINLTAR